jgi:hypothetical protein
MRTSVNYPRNIYCTVVVYNKSIDDSVAFRNLKKANCGNLIIIVVDNSTSSFGNQEKCLRHDVRYIDMHGNKGLSKAYNSALDYIIPIANEEDVVAWFDDDTDVPEQYFDLLNEAIVLDGYEVFVPLIRGQNGKIYSPNNANFLKNKLVKSIHEINLKKLNAINSCLAVRSKLFVNYRYDEKLFLDSVDQNFFDDLRDRGIRYRFMDIIINHDFSQRGEILDKAIIVRRLDIRVRDLMSYAQKKWMYTFLGVIKALGWGVVFSWKCRSVSPLIVCAKQSVVGFVKNFLILANRSFV